MTDVTGPVAARRLLEDLEGRLVDIDAAFGGGDQDGTDVRPSVPGSPEPPD